MIALDASVAVKWFREGEEFEKEALKLLEDIKSLELTCAANEWLILETVRALVKAGYSKDKIDDAYESLTELMSVNAIRKVSVGDVISHAKSIEYELKPYAADAVHLATAVHSASKALIREDRHLLQKKVKDYANARNLKILSIKEFM